MELVYFLVGLNMLLFIPFWIPVIVLGVVARNRRRSLGYCWWGALSYFGMVIGLIIMLTKQIGDPVALYQGQSLGGWVDPASPPGRDE